MEIDKLRKMNEYYFECARELARNDTRSEIEKSKKTEKDFREWLLLISINIIILITMYITYKIFGSLLK